MGIDVASLNFILGHKERVKGKTLQIGRQGMHFAGFWFDQDKKKENFSNNLFAKSGCNFNATDLLEPIMEVVRTTGVVDGHTEGLFERLGATSVDTMDYSPYENATIIHDLNDPVPEELHNQFDYILDAGTIEHIFDVKTVLQNINSMLKVGGVYSVVTNNNNFPGHGFYQFSPEFFRTAFSEQTGYQILSLDLVQLLDNDPYYFVHNYPEIPKGSRHEYRTDGSPYYITMTALKTKHINQVKNLQQSDYLKIWGEI